MSLNKTCPHCGAVTSAFGSAFERHQSVEHAALYDPVSGVVAQARTAVDVNGTVSREQAERRARRGVTGLE